MKDTFSGFRVEGDQMIWFDANRELGCRGPRDPQIRTGLLVLTGKGQVLAGTICP